MLQTIVENIPLPFLIYITVTQGNRSGQVTGQSANNRKVPLMALFIYNRVDLFYPVVDK